MAFLPLIETQDIVNLHDFYLKIIFDRLAWKRQVHQLKNFNVNLVIKCLPAKTCNCRRGE